MKASHGKGYSLQNVLITAFMLLIGVLLVFVVVTLAPRMSSVLQTNAIERTKETVLQGVNTLDIYVENLLSALHFSTSQLPTEPAREDETWKQHLLLIAQSRSDLATLAFFGEDGELFYATTGELRVPKAQVAQADWFTSAQRRNGTVTSFSKPHVQELFGDQRSFVITLSRSVEYLDNGIWRSGVLLMDVEYASVSAVITGIAPGGSGYAYLIDKDAELICHPKIQLIYRDLFTEDLTAVKEQTLGVTRDRQSGRERVLIITTVEQTRWRVVGVAYLDEISALFTQFQRILTIVVACAGLLSLTSATLMAYWVTRPIRHLEHKMQKVEAGDLNVTISETGFSEIRALSNAFNHMLWRIRVLMDRVVEEQEKKRLHELNALQAQINPHFLYNTLDSIVWMEERGRGKEAIMMVIALAKLFRISISKGRRFITVREELEHVRNYLIIQKMRFTDKFTYEISYSEDCLCERTVKLIVQPLVENCINHAIDEATGTELHIWIDARLEGEDILFTVRDDGVGIGEALLPKLLIQNHGESGIGLKNVHERIRLTYGKPYGLTIESVEDEGTTITIRIPRGHEEEG
ncbi:MAG: sensor histidine kinase [Clostridia bacterium]